MSRTISTRGPSGNFDTLYPDGIMEIFAEGVGEAMMGSSFTKLTLFQTRPADIGKLKKGSTPIEMREVVAILTMPTVTLVDAFAGVLAGVANSHGALQEIGAQQMQKLTETLELFKTKVDTAKVGGVLVKLNDGS